MKNLALFVLMLVTLTGCSLNAGAVSQTPLQVLALASLRESALRTARFSIELDDSYDVPPAVTQALGAQSFPSDHAALRGSGQLVFPRTGHLIGSIRFRGQQSDVESINANDTIYVKETGGWHVSSVGAYGWGPLGSPLIVPGLIDIASSARDRGDNKIDRIPVHHYAVDLDRGKLGPMLAGSPQDSPPGSILRQIVEHGNFTFEVWIDRDDLYLRKLVLNVDASIDLPALLAASAASQSRPSVTPSPSLPPGMSFTNRTHEVVTYRDFNAPMVITAPSPASTSPSR